MPTTTSHHRTYPPPPLLPPPRHPRRKSGSTLPSRKLSDLDLPPTPIRSASFPSRLPFTLDPCSSSSTSSFRNSTEWRSSTGRVSAHQLRMRGAEVCEPGASVSTASWTRASAYQPPQAVSTHAETSVLSLDTSIVASLLASATTEVESEDGESQATTGSYVSCCSYLSSSNLPCIVASPVSHQVEEVLDSVASSPHEDSSGSPGPRGMDDSPPVDLIPVGPGVGNLEAELHRAQERVHNLEMELHATQTGTATVEAERDAWREAFGVAWRMAGVLMSMANGQSASPGAVVLPEGGEADMCEKRGLEESGVETAQALVDAAFKYALKDAGFESP